VKGLLKKRISDWLLALTVVIESPQGQPNAKKTIAKSYDI